MQKQSVFVKPNTQGFCETFSYDEKYRNQDGWYHAIVDQDHLYGFGSMSYTVRYDFDKGILVYPDNWKKDQSDQIKQLAAQLQQAQDDNNGLKQQLGQITEKLMESVQNSNGLQKVVMNLQQQIANNGNAGKDGK